MFVKEKSNALAAEAAGSATREDISGNVERRGQRTAAPPFAAQRVGHPKPFRLAKGEPSAAARTGRSSQLVSNRALAAAIERSSERRNWSKNKAQIIT